MTPIDLANDLKSRFPGLIEGPTEFRGEASLRITDAKRIQEVGRVAKDKLGFDFLIDVSSVDHYGDDPRFEVVYEMYGLKHHCHLRLKIKVSEEIGEVPTVTSIWSTADWHEREIYDMMGIRFRGHPDLRRILMWEGYPFFPLRKDFPLAGKPSEMPDIAFSRPAPLEGGPFVTTPSSEDSRRREPRVRPPESLEDSP